MPLHPQAKAFVESLAERNPPGWEELSVAEGREVFASFEPMFGTGPELRRVENLSFGHGITGRLYSNRSDTAPAVIYFHGGGWVLGNLDTHDAICRRLAADSNCTVISVDYGLAPENRFPGPVEDCYVATKYVVDHANQLNVDGSRIAVAGDSAGGQLAAAVALKSREIGAPAIVLQVLIYPVVEPMFETESYRAFGSGYGLSKASMRWFWKQFLGDLPAPPLAAPIRSESLAGLPDTLLITAEYDVLRDEGEALARKLSLDGVDVNLRRYDGMLHGFVHFAALFDTGIEATRQLALMIKQRLSA